MRQWRFPGMFLVFVCRTPAAGATPCTSGVPAPAAGAAVPLGSRGVCWIRGSVYSAERALVVSCLFGGLRAVVLRGKADPEFKKQLTFVPHGACTCTGFCARPLASYHHDLPYPVSSLQHCPPYAAEATTAFPSPVCSAPGPLAPGVPTEASATMSPACRRL